jgi:N6-L-threonylcarbamoyladenine synthase
MADNNILAVGVSTRPRNVEGSYMPCFLAGVVAATSAATAAKVPLYSFSHQCGHLMAALYSSGRFDLLEKKFAAFHVSGGTTEFLEVFPENGGFVAEHIGGTKDLNAGQVIDRIGVMMDMPFPAGKHMEIYALNNKVKIPKKKICSEDLWINLSGLENMAKKLYDDTESKELTSAFVLEYIGNSLISLCEKYEEKNGKSEFVFSGGVMSNSILKEKLKTRFVSSFAEPALSADNAVGIAYLTLRSYNKNL